MTTLRVVDVPAGGDRVLRVGLYVRGDEPESLVLAAGTGQGRDWREDPAEGLTLPATALAPLRAALAELAAWKGAVS